MGNKILYLCDPRKNTICDKANECLKEPGCFGCWYTEHKKYAATSVVSGQEMVHRLFNRITKYDGVEHTLDEIKQVAEKDNVNHPAHYETGKFECIDVMLETQGKEKVKAFAFAMRLSIFIVTAEKNGREDIEKAVWYLNKYLELEETDEVQKE